MCRYSSCWSCSNKQRHWTYFCILGTSGAAALLKYRQDMSQETLFTGQGWCSAHLCISDKCPKHSTPVQQDISTHS